MIDGELKTRYVSLKIQNSQNFRKMHEKGLLNKVSAVEDKLAAYLAGMSLAIEDSTHGKVPNLDFDSVRLLLHDS